MVGTKILISKAAGGEWARFFGGSTNHEPIGSYSMKNFVFSYEGVEIAQCLYRLSDNQVYPFSNEAYKCYFQCLSNSSEDDNAIKSKHSSIFIRLLMVVI